MAGIVAAQTLIKGFGGSFAHEENEFTNVRNFGVRGLVIALDFGELKLPGSSFVPSHSHSPKSKAMTRHRTPKKQQPLI